MYFAHNQRVNFWSADILSRRHFGYHGPRSRRIDTNDAPAHSANVGNQSHASDVTYFQNSTSEAIKTTRPRKFVFSLAERKHVTMNEIVYIGKNHVTGFNQSKHSLAVGDGIMCTKRLLYNAKWPLYSQYASQTRLKSIQNLITKLICCLPIK